MGTGVDPYVEPRTEYGTDSRMWLGTAHGTQMTRTVSLDNAAMIAAFPDGNVPSGVKLGRVTATGLYRRAAAAATDGSQVVVGHLFSAVKIRGTGRTGVALYEHGRVKTRFLPTGAGDGTAPNIIYITG